LPPDLHEADVTRFLRANVPALNGALAELSLGSEPRSRVFGGGGPNDPDVSAATLALAFDDEDAGALDEVAWVSRTPDRETPHDLLVLVDMSGSTLGLVDAARDGAEARPSSFPPPSDFPERASDFANARIGAAFRLLRTLRPRDRVGIVLFSEQYPGGVAVPCARATGDAVADLGACFGGEHPDVWLGEQGLDRVGGSSAGRASLWQAVDLAYGFLRDGRGATGVAGASKDILVISDGPDTCGDGEAATRCEPTCSAVSAADVLARVEADQADASGPRVAIHVVQFESPGYPGPDARQQEVACASGGTYRFIPSERFPRDQPRVFRDAIDDAVLMARFALQGRWRLARGLPAAWRAEDAALGDEVALSGALVTRVGSHLVTRDTGFPLAPEYSWIPVSPLLRRPCATASDCGATDEAGACDVICSPETRLCVGGAEGVDLPANAACRGEEGVCCEGLCQPFGIYCFVCD
ncbi:MAG: hypothetical protein KC635_11240, partial [Myxococcales bacterium]|nr:hypothetical protein [Myxococcales bacterium]